MEDHFNPSRVSGKYATMASLMGPGSFTAHTAQGLDMHKAAISVSAEYSLFSSEKTPITVP